MLGVFAVDAANMIQKYSPAVPLLLLSASFDARTNPDAQSVMTNNRTMRQTDHGFYSKLCLHFL